MSSSPLSTRLPASWRPHGSDTAPIRGPAPASDAVALPARPEAALPRWTTPQLFGASQEVLIEHQQSVYRLRITSLGKLILTK